MVNYQLLMVIEVIIWFWQEYAHYKIQINLSDYLLFSIRSRAVIFTI